MDIKITAKNIKLTPAIKEFINTRVSKIVNFLTILFPPKC